METSGASDPSAGLYANLLKSTQFLSDDDKSLYQRTFEAVASETNIDSFLDWMDVKDYADKLLQERRFNSMLVNVIEDARTNKTPILAKTRRTEVIAASSYLPLVEVIYRLEENAAKTRRGIGKELRQMSRKRKETKTPSIVPGDNGTGDEE